MNHSEKVSILSNKIKYEVQDFHPLLKELFQRMTQFTGVDYTQGNEEYGADFVLESREDFGNEIYTGVIVKVGKITQKDLHEISRQVRECLIQPRLFKLTNKEINIKKVVIITNGSISKQARKVIREEYKNNLINFIDKEKLIEQIDSHLPTYWDDTRFELTKYFKSISEKCNSLLVGNSVKQFKDLSYVPIKVEKKDIKNSQIRLSDFRSVSSLDKAIELSDFILLEGGMGSGKSALIANFALQLVKNYQATKNIHFIPLVLEFSDYGDDIFDEIRKDIVDALSIIKKDVPDPKLLIFLDGFDEYHIHIDERKSFIDSLFKEINKFTDFKFVLTTREIEDYDFEIFLDKYFVQYKICPLQNNQIATIVQSFYSPTTKVRSEISTSELFNMLPKTPMTAILLGQILLHDPKELPSTITELYAKFTEMVLFRWDIRDLQSQTEYEVYKNICGNFAYFLLEHNLTTVSLDDLQRITEEYLLERNLNIQNESVFKKLYKNNELFLTNQKNNTIKFKHRSFCEYFYALHIRQNNKVEISQEIYNPYWQNSYFFLFGLIKDNSNLIEELSNIEFDSYGLKINQIIANAQFLLAAYVSPYSSIKSQVERSIKLAAETTIAILKDPNEKNVLKEMQMGQFELSMFMSIVISHSYNYEFFDKSLKAIADDVLDDSKLESTSDWLKVLFVTTTLAERGDSSYLEILSSRLKSNEVKFDNIRLKTLFGLIYQNNIEITENIKYLLKSYKKKMPNNPKMTKVVNLLLKGKRSDAQKLIGNTRH